jgi:transcriptional regulator with XRE-family HTH domain
MPGADDTPREAALIAALAQHVRAARQKRGLSIDRLAARAGISKGALVAVENAATNPNLATLCRISDALNVPVSALLDAPPDTDVQIVEAGDVAPLWRGPDGGAAALILTTAGPLPVELWRWHLHADERYENLPYPPGVLETVTVLEGTLRLIVGGGERVVPAGATASFAADVAHSYRGGAPSGCTMLVTVHLTRPTQP